jgi:hypothetical protein
MKRKKTTRRKQRSWELISITELNLHSSYAKAYPEHTSVFYGRGKLIAAAPILVIIIFFVIFSAYRIFKYNNSSLFSISLGLATVFMIFTLTMLLIVGYIEILAPHHLVASKTKIFKMKSRYYASEYLKIINKYVKRRTVFTEAVAKREVEREIKSNLLFEIEDLGERRQMTDRILKISTYAMTTFTIIILAKGGGFDKSVWPLINMIITGGDKIQSVGALALKVPDSLLWLGLAISETFVLTSADNRNELQVFVRGLEIIKSTRE